MKRIVLSSLAGALALLASHAMADDHAMFTEADLFSSHPLWISSRCAATHKFLFKAHAGHFVWLTRQRP